MVRRTQVIAQLLGLLILSSCFCSCSSPAGPPASTSVPAPSDGVIERFASAETLPVENPALEHETQETPNASATAASPSTALSSNTSLVAQPASKQRKEEQKEEQKSVFAIEALLTQTPRCAEGSLDCFGIHLHIVQDEAGELVRDLAWVSEQLAGAQDRFTNSVDATFEIVAVDALSDDKREIVSRIDRDRLGRSHFSRGLIHVFVVGSLANVDDPGEIRGVHWRDRSNTARRWVILSSIAGAMTLTHELGHFFSLPHSRYENSLMNKRPGGLPFGERGFHPREALRMRRAKKTMLKDGSLKTRTNSSD